ncbi:MAG: ribonuclease D [Spirochaetales bacterium]|nr:ribonuclease D [Spirochaetales bacterium]
MSDFVLIDSEGAWHKHAPKFLTAKKIALDLEGDFMLHRYGYRICLLQVGFPDGAIYLLDTLTGFDLSIFKEVLENQAIEKVLWGASNDVRYLKFLLGCRPRGMIDLWEAARLVIGPRVSLALVIQQVLGHQIQKDPELQVSDWNQRPLSEDQKKYAAQDVRYLLAVWDRWKPLLESGTLAAPFHKRMQILEGLEISQKEAWTRVKGWMTLSPAQQVHLKRLVEKRDQAAKGQDLAPWRIEKNENLLEYARNGVDWSP